MAKKTGPNKLNLKQTHDIFIEIGREEFVKNGFAATSTNVIVKRAEMARGSLYYHFGDKQGLFEAIYTDLMVKTDLALQMTMHKFEDPLEQLKHGVHHFLQLCSDKDFRKIILIEGLSTIPYQKRIAIIEKNIIGTLREIISACYQQGHFKNYEQNILIFFLYGLVSETGRSFEYEKEAGVSLELASTNIFRLLDQMAV